MSRSTEASRRLRPTRGRSRARPAAALAAVFLAPLGLRLAARLAPMPDWWAVPPSAAEAPSLVRVVDREGNLLARLRSSKGGVLPVRSAEVAPVLERATVAAEDRRFHHHSGVDLLAVARAAGQNLRRGRRVSGGSTITQQAVKLCRRGAAGSAAPRSLAVKAREAWWSLVVEAHASKEEILERYWNLADYGSDLRGVGAAAQLYFGHGVGSLTLEEAALLAALPRSPVRTDPRRDPEAARRARDRVLARMGLPAAEEEAARVRPIRLFAASSSASALAPHWIAEVARRAPEAAEIRLPIDARLQTVAAEALQATLRGLRDRGADAGAIVAMENRSGEVRAWVGSADWHDPDHGQFDAARARRQPGSALKPFTYALAFEAGLRPAHIVPDLPLEYEGAGGAFRPRNYSGRYHGPVRARLALANSWNAPAVALLSRLGPAPLRERLRAAGLESLDRPAEHYGLGLTLGAGEVSLLELVGAYSCLARGGVSRPRVEILEVRDAAGSPMEIPGICGGAAPSDGARVFDPAAAFFVLSTLSDEAARARAFGDAGPFAFPFPVAIKTGTSSDWRDNWAFGCTPTWTAGVWIGQARGTPMDRVSGTQGAILALRRVLCFLHEERDHGRTESFGPPAGLERRRICALSGESPGSGCPESIEEWFLESDPPAPACRWHRRVDLELATGREAGPDIPRSRVRAAVFTIPPADCGSPPFSWPGTLYADWGRANGWPDPPEAAIADPDGSARAEAERPATPAEAPRAAVSSSTARGATPRILRPSDGASYALDLSLPAAQQQIALEGDNAGRPLRWFVDGRAIGRTRPGEPIFWPLVPGRHTIRAVDAEEFGRGDPARTQVPDAPRAAEIAIEVEAAS